MTSATDLGALRVGPAVLAPGVPGGPLDGVSVVVKDLIDVAGVPTGAGNPDFLADAAPAERHAAAVARMLAAGATVTGKSHTDELAFSLSGTNVHYGTPLNPAAPGRIPGGSSSGSASAVAGGLVPAALATDTGGSIRVPASYCGIFGLRPTHGRVPLDGVAEFAPTFGTVGVLAAAGQMLARCGTALLTPALPAEDRAAASSAAEPGAPVAPAGFPSAFVLAEDLLAEADPVAADAVALAARRLAAHLGIRLATASLTSGRLTEWFAAFRGRQMVEAWRSHGPWISRRRPKLGPGIAARFEQARNTPPEAGDAYPGARAEILAALDAVLPPGGALILPSAATVAPPLDLDGPAKDDLRARTMRLTCVAGTGGLPAVSLPIAEAPSGADAAALPVGVCAVGRRYEDEALLALAAAVPEDMRRRGAARR